MSKETQSKKDNSSTSAAKRPHSSKTKPQAHPSAILQRAEVDIAALSSADLLTLQKTAGNQAVTRLLAQRGRSGNSPAQRSNNPVQPKLTVGPAGDKYEQEADQVAAQVMRSPEPSAEAPNDDESEPKAPNEPLQRTPIVQRQPQSDGFDPGSDFQGRLESKTGSGRALPAETRSFMEPRFGTDFNNVRVHTDSEAVQLNRDISAQAFTHGSDVFFGAGKYDPGSEGGKQLLAHELTHVVQQSSGVMRKPTIQRLMSSVELKRLAGEPKGDRGFWKLKKKMSTGYKDVLAKLDNYNLKLQAIVGTEDQNAKNALLSLELSCQTYVEAHTGDGDARAPHIQALLEDIATENSLLIDVAANPDRYPDMSLQAAIGIAKENRRVGGINQWC